MKSALNNKYLLGQHLNGKRILGIADKNRVLFQEIYKIATGTDITILDTKNDLGRITGFECASSQAVTVQGKNLYDKNSSINYIYNATGTILSTGMKVKGTMTNNLGYIGQDYNLKPSTQYTLSATLTAITGKTRIAVRDSTGAGLITLDNTGNKTFTTDSIGKGRLYFYSNTVVATGTFECDYTNVQLEQNTVATAYAPFIPNSPSPDYPSTIQSTGDGGILNVWSHKKNLFDYNYAKTWANTVSKTYRIVELKNLKPNTSYRLYNWNTTIENQSAIYVIGYSNTSQSTFETDSSFLKNNSWYRGFLQFTTKADGKVYLGLYNPTTQLIYENAMKVFENAMLVEGSSEIPYEPYTGNEYPITLPANYVGGSLPNGVKDTHDFKRIGKVVLNGSETWFGDGSTVTGYNRFYIQIPDIISGNNNAQYFYCDKFKLSTVDTTAGYTVRKGGMTNVIFQVPDTVVSINNVTAFKTWLASNITVLYYPLATPVAITIDKPVIKTFQDYNKIECTNAVKPVISAKYLQK